MALERADSSHSGGYQMLQFYRKSLLSAVLLITITASNALALDVGSDGLSGVLNPSSSVIIDLSLATTGDLADAGRTNGTYDPVRWAVIFKYSSVNIPNPAQVSFKNHPSGAPVVWLVQGNVTIANGGYLLLNGQDSNTNQQISPGGPGGFAGGRGDNLGNTSAGTGPGGGDKLRGGSYATSAVSVTGRTYGNVGILPLVGGSGGGANTSPDGRSGGGGGGAILIAANGTVTLGGTNCIQAYGGYGNSLGGGSGGAVRILATSVAGSGSIIAQGGSGSNTNGGLGRVRIEANTISLPPGGIPPYSTVAPLTGSELLFPSASTPTVRVSAVNGQPVSPTPNGELNALADLTLSTVLPITVDLVSANVPVGSTVTLRVVPINGNPVTYSATTTGSDSWQVTGIALPPSGVAQLQAKAVLP